MRTRQNGRGQGMAENKKQQKLIENAEAIKNKLKNDSKKIGSKLKSAGKTLAGGVAL